MTPGWVSRAATLAIVAATSSGCDPSPEAPSVAASPLTPPLAEPPSAAVAVRGPALLPLPAAPKVDPRRARLGARLFADRSISSDDSVACATCHPLDRGGADGLSHSRGAAHSETALNTPTVYNATFNFRFNWNGEFLSLEAEFDAPVTKTMKTTWIAIVDVLRHDSKYPAAFEEAYSDGITIENVKDALARYVDTLVTPSARFDQFLTGDTDALNAEERRGLAEFQDLGCIDCHQGANIGGNLFQRFGVMHDYFTERVEGGGPAPTEAERGRFNVTKNAADRYVFRVPSLRNVALTPPYFHDGSAPTLEHAVRTMAHVQLGRTLSPAQVKAIVAFLQTLTGVPAPAP